MSKADGEIDRDRDSESGRDRHTEVLRDRDACAYGHLQNQ